MHWAIVHRLQKPSSRWTKNRSCTNIHGGPLNGGQSTQMVLRDARLTALKELRREALMVGADAVIAMDLDYQELSGGGKGGMLMIVASGTAVAVKKKDNSADGS